MGTTLNHRPSAIRKARNRPKRNTKSHTLRFRVDPKRKDHWDQAMKELGVPDFSSYCRAAIDRAIHQDLRSRDPKWRAFIKAIQPKAREILGHGISDNFKDRVENLSEIEAILHRIGSK